MNLLQYGLSVVLFDTSMSTALVNTVLGMGTVFAVLIFISVLIGLFALIPKLEEMLKKKNAPEINTEDKNTVEINTTKINAEETEISTTEKNTQKVNAVTTIPSMEMIPERENLVDDQELVVVITAAIMASMGENAPTDGLVVRSIRKVNKMRWTNH